MDVCNEKKIGYCFLTALINFDARGPSMTICFLKNENQILVRSLNSSEESQILDLNEIHTLDPLALFGRKEHLNESTEAIVTEKDLYPIREAQSLGLNDESFEKMSNEECLKLVSEVRYSWTLQNSVEQLDQFSDSIQKLSHLFQNERSAFFEELWLVSKKILGAFDQRIIFNNLRRTSEDENAKAELVQDLIEGGKKPNPKDGSEIEKKIMESYQDEATAGFNLVEYHPEKNQFVLVAGIRQSPFVIMGKTYGIDKIQLNTFKALIEGIDLFQSAL